MTIFLYLPSGLKAEKVCVDFWLIMGEQKSWIQAIKKRGPFFEPRFLCYAD